MKIYTKKGDGGDTSILGNKRYSKSDLRICAIGEVDELNAHLGCIYASINLKKDIIIKIQQYLFVLGAQLAIEDGSKFKVPELKQVDVELLEADIDTMEDELIPMTHFILPTGDLTTGHIHIARAVCRRTERTLVALNKVVTLNEVLMQFINRLSDWIFVLARYYCLKNNISESKWIPEK